jgi:site-specific DNA-methyltransferase (adenine-specific)
LRLSLRERCVIVRGTFLRWLSDGWRRNHAQAVNDRRLPQRGGIVIRVEHGDCLEVTPRLVAEGITVDAIVTDPPYHLASIVKRFANADPARETYAAASSSAFMSRGFMGLQWDGGDIASKAETWGTCSTILRPGGYLLAFGGTRTHHRMVCAIEDAGFVIQDTVAWLYGSGFPKHKSHLKPAFEPICLAYKPGGERTMQIDECRIETGDQLGGGGEKAETAGKFTNEGWRRPWMDDPEASEVFAAKVRANVAKAETLGRWPANVCHDGSDEVLAAFPRAGGGFGSENRKESRGIYGDFSGSTKGNLVGYGDSGSAARFFFSAKAGADDRWGSRHPTVKPVELIRWLVQLVTPPGGLFLDPFAGSGTAGVAALATGRNAILIEQDEGYVADIRERLAHYAGDGRHSLAAKNRNRRETVGTLL